MTRMTRLKTMGNWLDRHQWAAVWGTFLAALFFVLRVLGVG